MKMVINIDPTSGFCFGVKRAIDIAGEELQKHEKLYCLGHIVHNEQEEARLTAQGLEVIDHDTYKTLRNATVLIRAHGEPPETYRIAAENNLRLIDATCPVVLKLQEKVNRAHRMAKAGGGQVVIYGRKDHPEVIGLAGNAANEVIVVENAEDVSKVNFKKPVYLFAQTTKNPEVYREITEKIKKGKAHLTMEREMHFTAEQSICRQVSGREAILRKFAAEHDVLVFVGGSRSSNARQLYDICRGSNPDSYFVREPGELEKSWFENAQSTGVTGATSTPQWLIESVAAAIGTITNEKNEQDVS